MDSAVNSPRSLDTPKSGGSSKDSTESTTGTGSSSHYHHHRSHHHHHHRHSSSSSSNSSIIRTNTGWFQRKVNLRPFNRGCHLVTDELVKQIPEVEQFQIGICNLHS